jgi:DNA (cytosine-5)-methyltransferase 1
MSPEINIGSLFSGIGGLELGLQAGLESRGHSVRTLWQVEQNAFCRDILSRHWPEAKRFDDVRDITKDIAEPVDILCGGFPCQDISTAGLQAGLEGARSGLFYQMSRIVRELRPKIWIMENVANIVVCGLPDVLREVAECGYHARWGCLRASDMGAPHQRNRWFCVAWRVADSESSREGRISEGTVWKDLPNLKRSNGSSTGMAYTHKDRLQRQQQTGPTQGAAIRGSGTQYHRETESGMGGTSNGFPCWMDIVGHRWPAAPGPQPADEPPRVRGRQPGDTKRLQALGNAVVPQQIFPVAVWIADNLISSTSVFDTRNRQD